MSYTDFLGNTIEVGDMIIYSPKGGETGELVLAEVLEIKETVKERWNHTSRTTTEYTHYCPTLQPVSSTSSYRNTQYKPGEGFVKATPRKIFLQDMSSTMLYKKAADIEENTE